jgi:hypothetical protein
MSAESHELQQKPQPGSVEKESLRLRLLEKWPKKKSRIQDLKIRRRSMLLNRFLMTMMSTVPCLSSEKSLTTDGKMLRLVELGVGWGGQKNQRREK